MQVIKHELIELTQEQINDYKNDKMDIVAFQLVTIFYEAYGVKMKDTFDTKINSKGEQRIIDGNGFFEDNYEIK